uniref:CPNIFS n=1 Tax=Arundo donax TaxID=35708 RepID=A0A0A9EDJ5_ARUDO
MQQSNACRATHLMRRCNKKICTKLLNINWHMGNTLTGIYKNFCSNFV